MGKYFPPTAAEIHAFGWGFMDGCRFRGQSYERHLKTAMQFTEDIRHEPHYYRWGYFMPTRFKSSAFGSIGTIAVLGGGATCL